MYKVIFKRIFDILIALFVLPFFGIALVAFAPIVHFTDGGPVFYNAQRIGKNGKLFTMYKFRSMYVDAPDIRLSDGSTYNSEDDPRVTKIGKFMRTTSIDEIPQIINVLKGDMSIVGPRPNLPTLRFENLDEPEQHRLSVRPGITGYSQAYFRNSINCETKTKNDNYYVDNLSFILDMKILLKTAFSVIRHKNIYTHSESDAENQANYTPEDAKI